MAHLPGDRGLLDAFATGADIRRAASGQLQLLHGGTWGSPGSIR